MDAEEPGVVRAGRAGAARVAVPGRGRAARRARSRFVVHLALLACLAGSLGTLQLLHIRNAIHAEVGLAFGGLAVVHLLQRRHRIAGMCAQLAHLRPLIGREFRLLASDAVLTFFAANVVVSGVLDWGRGQPMLLPLLPTPFDRWHLLSSVVLVAYLIAHVARRWRRIRRSTIR